MGVERQSNGIRNHRLSEQTDTVDGEVDPSSVDADVVAAVEKQDRALVPAVVRHPDVGQLDRRLPDGPNASVERRVHARRVAVEQDEDGRLDTELAPRDDMLDVHSARVADLTLQYPTGTECRSLAQRSSRSFGRRPNVIVLL